MTLPISRAVSPVGVDVARTVSNSEVSAFTQCERKHYYAHLRNLEPKTTGLALSRGIIGHEALAEYYENNRDPRAASAVIRKYLEGDYNADGVMLMELQVILKRYFAYYEDRDAGSEILAVEKSFEVPVNESYLYGMRLDALMRLKDGRIAVVDHKFVWDFYTQDVVDMNAQLPKYIGTVRFNGIRADLGILNQIRYRQKKGGNTDEETFRRTPVMPSNQAIRTTMSEQFKVSERIMARRAMSPEEQSTEAVRTMNQITCKNCSFLSLCLADLNGNDTTNLINNDYQPNSYNYNKEADALT